MTPIPDIKADFMDDPVICIHPNDPEKSLIIGTKKAKKGGGLFVYNLKGEELSKALDGAMNNVDIRYDFPLGDEKVDIVIASKRKTKSVGIYKVNFDTQTLTEVTAPGIELNIEPYGACMYKNLKTNKFYVLITTKSGKFHQYELIATLNKKVNIKHVRTVDIGSQTEGIVADDANDTLFVSEEDVGLWKYQADPNAKASREIIAKVGEELTADVEGVSIIQTGEKSGYIVVSSQGSDSYFVYDREAPHKLKGEFKIVDKEGMEGTEQTDGLDVCNLNLGSDFKQGLMVAHDNRTSKGGGSNFKLVSWEEIADTLDLETNSKWNPRYNK